MPDKALIKYFTIKSTLLVWKVCWEHILWWLLFPNFCLWFFLALFLENLVGFTEINPWKCGNLLRRETAEVSHSHASLQSSSLYGSNQRTSKLADLSSDFMYLPVRFWNKRVAQNWERSTSMLFIDTLLI